jgi:glycosyltransferase involved in cell wall biosynthesis
MRGEESLDLPSQRDIQTSIVLPAYNESETLEELVFEIQSVCERAEMAAYGPVEILVVDDGSTDGSRELLRTLSEEVSVLSAIFLQRNFGQSAALAAGIDIAAGELIVTMDADGQNDPADVPPLLATLSEGADCVSGWRRDRQDPLSKTIPSKIQTRLAMLTGPQIHDFGCTLKAYRAAALKTIDLYGEGHRYIPAKLHKRGYTITEQEVNHRPRAAGHTKYGTRRLVRGLIDLLFILFWNRYSTRPIHFLGGGGIMLMTAGFVIGSHAVILKYLFNIQLVPRLPRLVLTATLLIFGFQSFMFGVLAEMIAKQHYRDELPYQIGEVCGFNRGEDTVPTETSNTSRGL